MAISSASTAPTSAASSQATPLVMRIIGFCALAHLINDLIQSVLPAIYPMLKANYDLSFAQIGMITLTFQITASLLQPWVGFFTDRRPAPNLLPLGTLCTLVGIVMLAFVGSFPMILLASALVGIGSSTFQVGGNTGSALGPLLAAAIVIPFGQSHVAWFGLAALFFLGVTLMLRGLSLIHI